MQSAKEDEKVETPNLVVLPAANALPAAAADNAKLSALEKKRQKQAEKAARRAQVVAQKEETGATSTPAAMPSKVNKDTAPAKAEKTKAKEASPNTKNTAFQNITKSEEACPYTSPNTLYQHLPQRKELSTKSAADMEHIHKSVQVLGFNMVDYKVVGSNDRLVAMLRVLQGVRVYKFLMIDLG